MKKQGYRILFIVSDIIASGIAWSLFFIYRKVFIETVKFGVSIPIEADFKFLAGLFLIPLFWFLIFNSVGMYDDIRHKTQHQNAFQLFYTVLLGSVVIFFLILLDDTVISYINYYQSFIILVIIQYLTTLIFRFSIISYKNRRFRLKKDQFRVIVVGKTKNILRFSSENFRWINQNNIAVVAYIITDDAGNNSHFTSPVGETKCLSAFIDEYNAEEVFIVSDSEDKAILESLFLEMYRKNVFIRILPELYPIIKVPVKFIDLFNAPLLLLSKDILPAWHRSIKVLTDIAISFITLITLLPLIIILVFIIKLTSKGPVIYNHERIGKNGRKFYILKFRSMYLDSEPSGPQLSTRADKRITPIGLFMRKRRLDEIPNFINVLKGDMSLVGPRPERSYYIEQIIAKAPQYSKLHLVKPGITSWGQVKFGYAENIDDMVKRMRYDLVYIENMSLYTDFQILFRTISIVLKGKGI